MLDVFKYKEEEEEEEEIRKDQGGWEGGETERSSVGTRPQLNCNLEMFIGCCMEIKQ